MFLGQYERTLDDKGRLAIPTELRNGAGTGCVLTRGFDNCLCIYPAAKWEAMARAVDDLPQVRSEVRDLARSLFGSATNCEFDRQGRVVIPAFLREHAALHAEAVVVGVNSRIEIWDRAAWLAKQQMYDTDGPRFAEALSASGM